METEAKGLIVKSGSDVSVPCSERFVLGRDKKTRLYVADRKSGRILMDTAYVGSKECSLLKAVLVAACSVAGILLAVKCLEKSSERKRKLKLQTKEIKSLRRLCKKSRGKNGNSQ